MKKQKIKNNFFSKHSVYKKIVFILGLILLITGIIFIILSLKYEILEDKYLITEVTNYNSKESKKLNKGEIQTKKTIEYQKKGIYKITYKVSANKAKGKELLEQGTYLNITEQLGEGYELVDNKITIDNKEYILDTIDSEQNIISIDIPSSSINNSNIVELNIKLIGRNLKEKYETSQNSYYGFSPSMDNDFYNKKSYQTYIIEGNSHIKLENK